MKHYCPAQKRRMPEHELPCITKKECNIKRCQFLATYKREDKPFPLVLNHSDCDGEYSLEQLPELLRELEEIQILGVDDYEQSEKFIRLCKAALEHKKPIVFA